MNSTDDIPYTTVYKVKDSIGRRRKYMENLPEELDFLKKLNSEDKQRFMNMTAEQKRNAVTENMLAHEEERKRQENADMNQLVDRIASKSFQG
ncbi:MAG: hypothetical protein HFH69_07075 [Lachnospiraceae bacterium]|nr:hypothetical protein [Lachnospiraceae bacterium]